ncbi:hypothetical protein [Roseateles sp. L2-2]|uniref:hypothetical protein n=1 Tax=Roseateles sp. L2-2 TaxID=3422597 RepID=UPI003D369CC8
MTPLTPFTFRLMRISMANLRRLQEEMNRLRPGEVARAMSIKRRLQTEIATLKTGVQLHRSIERKILSEQR